ncbi:MAG: peptide ABC transporter substrate-binding protein [Alphaproteobacteria bacterium]|nr:peptide ABC transporter substrate-binding protein [Alphaproteobacteria bacterium]
MFTRRRFSAATAAAAGLLSQAGSGTAAGTGFARIRVDADLRVLDPAFQIGGTEEMIKNAVLVTLTRFTAGPGIAWEPYAAEEIAPIDERTIRFTLRPGLVWSDGFGPLTADDVKFSFERIADAANLSPWGYVWEFLDRVEVVDDRSGVIHLTQPFAPIWFTALPWYGGHIVCRTAVTAAGGKFETAFPAQCGPYRMTAWDPTISVTLERNPDWPGEAAPFDRLELIIIQDDKAAELAYEAEDLDYTRISVDSISHYRATLPAGTALTEWPSTSYRWIGMNVDHPHLQDIRVRQAIQWALDVDAILIAAFGGVASRSAGIVPPGEIGERTTNRVDRRDLDKARALLAEAGLADGFTTTFTCLDDVISTTIAQAVQALLAEVGITLEVRGFEAGMYWTLGLEEEGEAWRDLELTLMGYAGGADPSESTVWFTPDQVGVWNWERWNSPEFGELHAAGLVETDPEKRHAIYVRMQDLMEESGAYVFLTFGLNAAIHRADHETIPLIDGFQSLPRYHPLVT